MARERRPEGAGDLPSPVPEVVIERPEPTVDGGRFPAKAIVGDPFEVRADVFAHGHDLVRAVVRIRRVGARRWAESPMRPEGNDAFTGVVTPSAVGPFEIEIAAGLDHLASFMRDARRRLAAGIEDPFDAETGAVLLAEAADGLESVGATDAGSLRRLAATARSGLTLALLDELEGLAPALSHRPLPEEGAATVRLRGIAAAPRAAFSTWYELFPRSASPERSRPGVLRDVIDRLDYVADLGFDVLYLPPIHPIGHTARKGKGNSPRSRPDDVGSPWAIGSAAGGHTAVAPELGTLEDFDLLVEEARRRGIEVALDLAFQCSPDHPWVHDHPSWFRHRPDGSIACAENPPKRYEDIYPLDFSTEDWAGLWQALAGVVRFWVARGVRVFRVDNPHTKPFAFWEWLIAEVKKEHPEVLFLSEAFTRPKVMHRLAKLGFDQSYTYFAWRNSRSELEEYFRELTSEPGTRYFRPNVWPNTPDILPESLQEKGRAAFIARLVLAAGLSANYGIYGPVFELCWSTPAAPGSEEYKASEKYEVHHHDLDDPASIAPVVAKVNDARRRSPALQRNEGLAFHSCDNEQIICWSKRRAGDVAIGVVNLDPRWTQSGFVHLDPQALGMAPGERFRVHDVLSGERYLWEAGDAFVKLDPAAIPAHLLLVESLP
ncbi:MAG TPA: maltotransferase domain-containing protein [Acidimicrobiales bacterium]|nr:maltotransferase domain-containing protein [Acidimicrobiales bacterium]